MVTSPRGDECLGAGDGRCSLVTLVTRLNNAIGLTPTYHIHTMQ